MMMAKQLNISHSQSGEGGPIRGAKPAGHERIVWYGEADPLSHFRAETPDGSVRSPQAELSCETRDELAESPRIAQRRSMAETDEAGLEGGKSLCGATVLKGIRREKERWLAKRDSGGQEVKIGQYVAQYEHAIGLPPKRDVAGRVTRSFQHGEPAHEVPLA